MANRPFAFHCNGTEREKGLIQEEMAQIGTRNMNTYLHKMAIGDNVVNFDSSDVGKTCFRAASMQ